MSVKKLLILSAAGVASLASAAAIAGGVAQYQGPAVAPQSNTGVYIEANLGYARTNITKGWPAANLANAVSGVSVKNKNGGWTFGADIGYQLNKNLGLELGGFYLPTYKATVTGSELKIKSWAGYGAVKLSVPMMDQLNLFAKAGIGYLHVKESESGSSFIPSGTTHNWDPMFAVGVDYNFSQNISANATLTHFQGKSKSGLSYPGQNLLTVGVGYMFAM